MNKAKVGNGGFCIKNESAYILFAALLFIISLGVFSSHFYLIAFIALILKFGRGFSFSKKDQLSHFIIWVIIVTSFLNEVVFIMGGGVVPSIIQLIPYSILILFTMVTSQIIPMKIWKWFVLFVLLEIIVGVYEKTVGIQMLYSGFETLQNTDLLQEKVVFGLDTNSSGFAEKIFLAILLYDKYDDCKILKGRWFYPLIIIGLFISFNRTAIIASTVFLLIKLYSNKLYRFLMIPALFVLFYFICNSDFYELIIMQFTRGSGSFDVGVASSERDMIYPYYIKFIKDNPILGNGSFKYLIDMHDGRILHAHNSYLEMTATNGIPIALLYMSLLVFNIRKSNFRFIIPMMVFALTQTFFFWGLSLADLLLYTFLLKGANKEIPARNHIDKLQKRNNISYKCG